MKTTVIWLMLLLSILAGCRKDVTLKHTRELENGLTYTVETKYLKHHSDIKSVFLHINLTIENNTDKVVYLNIGKIKAILNGTRSTGAYHDSIASIVVKDERLGKGITRKELYLSFPETVKKEQVTKFIIIASGIR
jgi:hypothetical protein